jgi:guanylate kinase
MKRGTLFVIAAPSGAGKTSLVQALLKAQPQLHLSVSHTTRTRRPTETPGREYHFVSVPQFESLVARGEFLEHARVFDHLYGTARAFVERELQQGHDVVLEIDWQGAQQVRRAMPQCVTVFILPPSRRALAERLARRATDSAEILPPSRRALAERLARRATDSAEVIARRLRDAAADMSHYREFDYVVVNDDFDQALRDLQKVLAGQAQGLKSDRPELAPLLADLLASN